MSLYGSIKEVQNNIEKLYLKLEQRFNENKLIRDLWSEMAENVSQQIHSLRDLPKSFWIRFKKDQVELIEKIKHDIKPQSFEIEGDISLSDSIDKAIQSEEAMIVKIYVPLIRNLRKNWTGQALNFYIMVKAHIVGIKRVAEAFSGDPIVMRHAALLFQRFEKEIQEPEVEIIQKIKSASKRKRVRGNKTEKPRPKAPTKTKAKKKTNTEAKPKKKTKPKPKVQAKPKKKTRSEATAKTKTNKKTKTKTNAKAEIKTKQTQKQSQSPISGTKIRRNRPKPLVEKTEIRRRRARR